MSERPTICHVTSVNIPTDGRILYHECRSLAKRWRTVLVCRDDSPARTLEGVEIVTMPRRGGRMRRWAEIRRVVALAEAQHADLYHFHNVELLPAMAKFAARCTAPVIYDSHEHHPDAMMTKSYIPMPLRRVVAWWVDRTERRLVPRFDAVVVADEALERRYAELGAKRVLRLDNFPPLDLFRPGQAAAPERPTLVYVGSISEVRGYDDMLETIRLVRRELPSARLVLVGTPTEEIAARVHERDPDAVTLEPPVPYGEIAAVMQRAHVGIALLRDIPKFQKNVPTKVFDYMAAGIPYVSTDLRPVRALTEGGIGGRLVPPSDPASAASAVLELLRDPGAARQVAAEGRALIERQLNWEALEPSLFALYEELLS